MRADLPPTSPQRRAAAPRPESSDHDRPTPIVGVASNVSVGGASRTFASEFVPNVRSLDTLRFLVNRFDPAGNRMSPIVVEFPLPKEDFLLHDGDTVEVDGKYKAGVLCARSVFNHTLRVEVRGGFPMTFKVVAAFIIAVFMAVVIAAAVVIGHGIRP